jgi:hypothetical protein
LIAVIGAEDDSAAHLATDAVLARGLLDDSLSNAVRKNGSDEIARHPVVGPGEVRLREGRAVGH